MKRLRRQKAKHHDSQVDGAAVDVHAAPKPDNIVQLQTTIGNSAVQRLINDGTTIQRFGFLGDLWDSVSEAGSSALESIGKAWNNTKTPAQATEKSGDYNIPQEAFTVTDASAVIRKPPPVLTSEKGKPIIPEGTQVKVTDVAVKDGKFYVQLEDYLAADAQGPVRNFGWTSAGNLAGLPAKLAALNPKAKEQEDVVIPRPSSDGVLGLPTKPDIKNAEFDALVSEIETLEKNPVGIEKKHNEETGDDRTKRVEKIGDLRERIAALATSLSAAEAKQAQAYLYRRLAPLAPYLNQIANTHILGDGELKKKTDSNAGWMRTCNVTVPAMVLEGIGKTKDDYAHQDKLPLLRKIFDALGDNYKQRREYEDVTDFDDLRFPDFLAVVAISKQMDGVKIEDANFATKVADARKTAARVTTAHSTMMWLLDQFDASHQNYAVHASELEKIGGAQRDYTKAQLRGQNPESWRELYNRVESKEVTFDSLSKEEQKRYKTMWKYEQFDKDSADAELSVSTYRDAVLKKVNPLLDKGAQIIVGMEEHFVRLDSLDETGIQVDDPGEKGFKNLRVTWEQARNLGYFKTFWSVNE